ncbi:MAG: hypothetical protein HFI19_00430 [Lachnospiraceae bacterium]|jgi:hypothetical protein|uniref:hypothetical protein n=1 Tax=Candidatus Merdisoma sp. JLR.KK006 TaxID=3112626 RepID=UPI002FF1F61C|nr:hypothetical protein [Lachnospiraceae bacterium]
MADQELWTELLKQMHRRYQAVDEVFRQTKEIADALSRDDRMAAQMLLGMRQEELDRLTESKEKIYLLLECADQQERTEILNLLEGKCKASLEASFEEKKIGEIGENIRRNLEKIVALDRMISVKLAGKDSFYKQP